MKVLMSIKPEYAERIFDGSKKWEFRRVIFKNPDVKTVVVYASSPVQRVIGEFEIESILCDRPNELWMRTKAHAGITWGEFFAYYVGKRICHAIKIGSVTRYKEPIVLESRPPQNFRYIEE